ncbi:MAG TPA: metal-sensitive transcriptional regulator [Ktedonobacterales bacterium]|nr:metal-sensitive transcriptional regulator [Ktedonobacterales bacterium]
MSRIDEATQVDALRRLRRIEGQARGLQRMITEGRDCREVIQQLIALRAASHAVSIRLLEAHATQCLNEVADGEERQQALAQLVGMIARLAD